MQILYTHACLTKIEEFTIKLKWSEQSILIINLSRHYALINIILLIII